MPILSTKQVQIASASIFSFLDWPIGAETSLRLPSLQQEMVADQISRG